MKHKKRTYRKEQPKETLVVWDILKNETVAFLDTEYVTTQQKHGRPAKLVSVGMVICRGDFEEVDRFHSYIHMDGELHDKFRELTGITEKDLSHAPSYEKVMEQVGKKLDEYEVEHIFVWGPGQDRHSEGSRGVSGDDLKKVQKNRKSYASYDEGYRSDLFSKTETAQYWHCEPEIFVRTGQ